MKGKGLLFILILACTSLPINAAYYYVNINTGNDSSDGLAPVWDGLHGPKATLQAGLDAANSGDIVIAAEGSYSGMGNRDLDFQGKALSLKSTDPCDQSVVAATIIDSGGTQAEPHRGFYFHNQETTDSVVSGFTITNGYAWGGGIYCVNSSPTISYCIITGNNSPSNGAAIQCEDSYSIIHGCSISNNTAQGFGGGIYCDNSGPLISNCSLTGNSANSGGGFYGSSLIGCQIIECSLSANRALNGSPSRGGGICCESDSILTIRNSLINGNYSLHWGGGMYFSNTNLEMINCLITGNKSGSHGGGIYGTENSIISIANATISGNASDTVGGGIRCYNNSFMTLTNCILWGNQADTDEDGPEIALAEISTMAVSHSDVQGGQDNVSSEPWNQCVLEWDNSNINQNPFFTDTGYWDDNSTPEDTSDDFWQDGDYRLLSNSPCINQGDNTALAGVEYDLQGNNRIFNGVVDFGAYELELRVMDFSLFMAQAGLNRSAPKDSFMARGSLDMLASEFQDADSINVSIWNGDNLIFDSDPIIKNPARFLSGRYFYTGPSGGISLMLLDLNQGSFLISGNQVDLSGLQTPLMLTIEAGDYYGVANVTDDYLTLPLSFKFLLGVENALRVDRALYRNSSLANADLLLLMGAISVDDLNLDLSQHEVTLRWGTFEAVIPAGSEGFSKTGSQFIYRKPLNPSDPSTTHPNLALFNLQSCSFIILINGIDIPQQPNPVNFSISFDGFQASDSVTY